MAQPIAFHPAPRAPAEPERLQSAPAEHAEALLSAYELLQALHDKGVLSLFRGLVDGGDAVIGTVTAAVNTPESIRAIRNFMLLTKVFASIPPETLIGVAETIGNGAKRGKTRRAPGLLSLLWRLRSEDSRHAAALALDVLEGVGKQL